MKTNLTLT